MIGSDDTVVSVILEVNPITPKTDEVKLEDSIVGYITQAEHCFIAFAGPRPRSAGPRGSFDLWDKAAAELLLQRMD